MSAPKRLARSAFFASSVPSSTVMPNLLARSSRFFCSASASVALRPRAKDEGSALVSVSSAEPVAASAGATVEVASTSAGASTAAGAAAFEAGSAWVCAATGSVEAGVSSAVAGGAASAAGFGSSFLVVTAASLVSSSSQSITSSAWPGKVRELVSFLSPQGRGREGARKHRESSDGLSVALAIAKGGLRRTLVVFLQARDEVGLVARLWKGAL